MFPAGLEPYEGADIWAGEAGVNEDIGFIDLGVQVAIAPEDADQGDGRKFELAVAIEEAVCKKSRNLDQKVASLDD